MFRSFISRFAFVFSLSVLIILITGCNLTGDYGNGEDDNGNSGVAPEGLSNLRVVFAGASDTLSLSINASIGANQVPKGEMRVTVVKPGDFTQQYAYKQEILLDSSDTKFDFKKIPALPAIVEVTLSGSTIGGYTSFRGAGDLISGENVIFVNPKDSGLTYDLAAAVLQEILLKPELLKYSGTRLITDILYCLPIQTSGMDVARPLSDTVASVTAFLSTFVAQGGEIPLFENVAGDLSSPTTQISLGLREAFLTSVNGIRANVLAQEKSQDRVILNQLKNAFSQIRSKLNRQSTVFASIRSTKLGVEKNLEISLPGGVAAIDGPGRDILYETVKFTPTEMVISGGSTQITAKGVQVTANPDGVITRIILSGGSCLAMKTLSNFEDSTYNLTIDPGVRIEMTYARLPQAGFSALFQRGNTEIGIMNGWLGTETIKIDASSGNFGFSGEFIDRKNSANDFRFNLSLMGLAGQFSYVTGYAIGPVATREIGAEPVLTGETSKEVYPDSNKADKNITFPGSALTISLGLETKGADAGSAVRVKRLWMNIPNMIPWTGILSGNFDLFAGIDIKGVSGGAEFDFGSKPPAEVADIREFAVSFNSLSFAGPDREIQDGANLFIAKQCRDGNDYKYSLRSSGKSWKLIDAPPVNRYIGGSEAAEQVDSIVFPGRAAWKFNGSRRLKSVDGKELQISFQTLLEYDDSSASSVTISFNGVSRSLFARLDRSKETIAGKYYKEQRQADDGINLEATFEGQGFNRNGQFQVKYAPDFVKSEYEYLDLRL